MTYCIHRFMLGELGLRGGDLLIFAVIYSFTHGERGSYYGTQKYLSDSTGLARSSVKRSLTALLDKGYIEKFDFEDRIAYKSSAESIKKQSNKKTASDSAEEEYYLPSARRTPTNGDGDPEYPSSGIIRPKYNFLSVSRDDCVRMTDKQYEYLLKMVGSEALTCYIRRLELLIQNQGYRTFSPYKTIKKWILSDAEI